MDLDIQGNKYIKCFFGSPPLKLCQQLTTSLHIRMINSYKLHKRSWMSITTAWIISGRSLFTRYHNLLLPVPQTPFSILLNRWVNPDKAIFRRYNILNAPQILFSCQYQQWSHAFECLHVPPCTSAKRLRNPLSPYTIGSSLKNSAKGPRNTVA